MLFRSLFSVILLFFTLPLRSQNSKPNIIFILADDLGYGDLGCYGQTFIETPNLDSLAKNGIQFSQFYAGSAVCAPSRASLLTGMHTGTSPIRGNKERFPQGQFPLPDSTVTIATTLKDHGYNTSLIGKWGLGFTKTTGDPIYKGFESFYGYNCQRKAHRYYPRKLWDNQKVVSNKGRVYSHYIFTEKALEYVEEQKDSSFFLYLTYTIPHAKLQIPEENTLYYKGKIKNDSTLKKLSRKDKNKTVKYSSMVSLMDHDIGLLVAKLDSLNILDNTIIFFASDNGPHTESGYNPKILNSSGGFRGIKRDLYEGGIRVPLIVSWRNIINPGTISNLACAAWDFFPTIDDILDIPNNQQINGISILPTKKKKKQKAHDYLYWEFPGKGGKQAILQNEWKLVSTKVNSSTPKYELFNLTKDPKETNNLVNDEKDIFEKLKTLMNSAHVKNRVFKFKNEK